MHKFLFLIFLLISSCQLVAGNNPEDFTRIDEFARNMKKSSNFELTAQRLTAPYEMETHKVRSIFIWITENMEYDIDKYKKQQNKNSRTEIFANSMEELNKIKENRERKKATDAFRSERGVCEDYVYLLKYMCQSVGIESKLIGGYGRFSPQSINKIPRVSNHAWNGVKINGHWYLMDATWAAGLTNILSGSFKKQYNEGFFMAKPELFILSHFPDDPEWQLLEKPLDKTSFSKLPFAYAALSGSDIVDYYPKFGAISNNAGEIELKVTLTDANVILALFDNNRKSDVQAVKRGNEIIFSLSVRKLKKHELTIARIDGQKVIPIITYLVI